MAEISHPGNSNFSARTAFKRIEASEQWEAKQAPTKTTVSSGFQIDGTLIRSQGGLYALLEIRGVNGSADDAVGLFAGTS
jgi:hypothetical protein